MQSYSVAERINSDVNASVSYKTDLEQYSKPEHWCLPTDFGDCEDYALLKRHRLIESGFARKDLHLACCWTKQVLIIVYCCVERTKDGLF